MDNGRPLGMSEELLPLREDLCEDLEDFDDDDDDDLEEDLEEEDDDDLEDLESREEEWREELLLLDLDEDLEEDEDLRDESCGTSSIFNSRPVVGSTTESTPGLWET